ncbi:unnamed protein product [Soboliphyme baturini]|uniref:General transcription factor IIH subunit 4 n=1 Tax=Soboliphyme baturini TaxID=241478 RepID=A0A183JAM2_9BILA|nr:unnamed protein product [Soboliphyme baturini]
MQSVLRYLALPSEDTERTVSVETKTVLQEAGLLHKSADGLAITSYGFQFLLMDYAKQIWSYLVHYLEYMEKKSSSPEEAISFLLASVFCSLDKAYTTEMLSSASLNFLQHLRGIGLVYQRKRKAGWFCFTALTAILSNFTMSLSHKPKGFLIVETNFRLYAFTGE